MNREGLQPSDLIQVLNLIKKHQRIQLVGLMSHLSDADIVDTQLMDLQIEVFKQYYQIIIDAGFEVRYRHI
jgi:alanine racemase